MPPRHVLIIGGGLAGPSLALALYRRSIKSTIFEIRPEPSTSGGSISLAPNALRPLDKLCGVYEGIKKAGYGYTGIGVYAEDGYKFGVIHGGDGEEKGSYPTFRIMRNKVHRVLLDACEEKGIEIKYGVVLKSIKESEEGVTATFEDGSTAEGDMLVGADGIHSKVREHVLGSSAPDAIFSGSVTVNGFRPISAIRPEMREKIPCTMFTPQGLVFIVQSDADRIAWGTSLPAEDRTREGWTEFEQSGQAAAEAKEQFTNIPGLEEGFKDLLENTDEKKSRLWAPYYIPDLPTWYLGRVLLVGDAAHALPPNGQGSAMAFEDVAYLSALLSEMGSGSTEEYERIFRKFEEVRRQRIEEVKKLSKAAGNAKSAETGGWAWYLKKWFILGYFAWNRYLIRNDKVMSYDVTQERGL